MWVDSHCHLPADPAEADVVLDRARAGGVDWMVCVGTDLATSRAAVALAERHDDVHATVGLHPHDASRLDAEWPALVELAGNPAVVGIGEAGFDLHYTHSPFEAQEAAFRVQVELAHVTGRALVIHSREAWDHTFRVLGEIGVPSRTVFHCFTGGPQEARRALDLGTYLSFSGIVTFKSADDLRAAAALAPLDRVLVETDSPYLAPVPNRGKPCRPAMVLDTLRFIASLRGDDPDELGRAVVASADAAFALPA
jgi:TatD DNase family protein